MSQEPGTVNLPSLMRGDVRLRDLTAAQLVAARDYMAAAAYGAPGPISRAGFDASKRACEAEIERRVDALVAARAN